MPAERGRFIVFEGIDGAGKTTQIGLLADYLKSRGRTVFRTAEPTDLPTGKLLREALSGRTARTACELAALFTADRVSHNAEPGNGIAAHLAAGEDVICDRYYYSTLAYQGSETDLSPEESMARITRGRTSLEIFETTDRLARVREQFRRVFASLPGENVQIVNAAGSIEQIQSRIREIVDATVAG